MDAGFPSRLQNRLGDLAKPSSAVSSLLLSLVDALLNSGDTSAVLPVPPAAVCHASPSKTAQTRNETHKKLLDFKA